MPIARPSGSSSSSTAPSFRELESELSAGWNPQSQQTLAFSGDLIGWAELPTHRCPPALWQNLKARCEGADLGEGSTLLDDFAVVDGAIAAAIGIALWDARGKETGQSISELLGGRHRDTHPAYASLQNAADTSDPIAHAVNQALGAVACGYRMLKMKVGYDPQPIETTWLNEVLSTVPSTIAIAIDANRAMTVLEARRFLDTLTCPERIAWFEEPLSNGCIANYADLRKSAIPLAGGESLPWAELWSVAADKSMDIVNPDLVGHGGLGPMAEFWDHCEACGVKLVPHCFDGQLTRVATLQFLASRADWSVPLAGMRAAPLECDVSPNPLRDEILSTPLVLDENGHVGVPPGPGLGVIVNEDILARYAILQT